ncbi:drebrin-like protein B [Anthonomus grandis grandis]|uniref:drebrin-like protein B n=1 Tax=Anthonomus grandis grandis TaxID=2921223 RepID=UPI00216568AB|nr:drebrin-like protein B [Anthonomus grandis grandis]
MTVDLSRNNAALKDAWKDVLNDKTDTNWALFGYEGQTNSLKLVSKGDGGINELKEDLNSGKIMYAFVKLNDPTTTLEKCVLIHWQGEGANTVRKGICANHLRDIERFFTGAHLTYNARNEDEVDEDILIEKLRKVGSEYKFKTKVAPIEPAMPVGTRYQKVNAVKEINSQERDKFWKKEEEEEKVRLEQEKQKKQEEQIKLEKERQQREEKEAKKRDQESELRNERINQIKKIEQEKETETHIVAPEKPLRTSILKTQIHSQPTETATEITNLHLEPINTEQPVSDDEGDQFATIKRSPKDPLNSSKPVETPTSPSQEEEKTNSSQFVEQTVNMLEQDFVDEYIYGIAKEGYKARALYDYQAADDTEISFDPGDLITNIEKVDEGWWQGLAPDGITYGLFPANYVEQID